MSELYKLLRPTSFKQMFGNAEAVKQCYNWVKNNRVPHFVLFSGGSGMGKTTLARIMKTKLKCGDFDFEEINAAGQARGIEKIKTIESQINLAPLQGPCRIYLVDEAHMLTKDAQNAFLKMLEDTPKHVYFFFCTTDPQKLIPTIRTRATIVNVAPLAADECLSMLEDACERAEIECESEVLEAIVEASGGSSRKALVLLNQIKDMEPDEQLASISKEDVQRTAIELCRVLMNPKSKWQDAANILKGMEEDAESFRWMMLGYASSVILKGGPIANRAFVILDQFSGNYYDSKKAGLLADCWEVIHGRK